MNKMELLTHECLQFWLPRIAVALEEIAKAAKFDMEEKKTAKEEWLEPTLENMGMEE